jgi:hypothetical protein
MRMPVGLERRAVGGIHNPVGVLETRISCLDLPSETVAVSASIRSAWLLSEHQATIEIAGLLAPAIDE